MKIAQHPEKYFGQNQYLLANSAYANTQQTIPAYKSQALEDPDIKKLTHILQSQGYRMNMPLEFSKDIGQHSEKYEINSEVQKSSIISLIG